VETQRLVEIKEGMLQLVDRFVHCFSPYMLKICKKLQEKRFVFVKILAIIIPENGAKVSKIKCLRLNQQTLIRNEKIEVSRAKLLREFLSRSYLCSQLQSTSNQPVKTCSKFFEKSL